MAEFGALDGEFRAAGVALLGIAVDRPARAAALRRELGLGFPILCDVEREVLRGWGLLDPIFGGIARPATYWIDAGLAIRFASIGTVAARVSAATMLAMVRGTGPPAARSRIPRRWGDMRRAFRLWRATR